MLRLRVKEVAQAKGYDMSKLSRATDISFNTIKRLWQKPYEGANVQTLARIAKVLDVTINDLTEEVPDEKAPDNTNI
jgi:DNA-binding Xre family transcriptional regulator